MIWRALLALAIAGCGDNLHLAPDASPPPDAGPRCTATYSGNVDETSTTSACATVAAGGTLQLVVPTTTLATTLPISIDLGPAPVPGYYSSETTATWGARAGITVGVGACIYLAGSAAVPHGSFALALASVDLASGAAHGDLQLTMYVLSSPATACGTEDTESLAVAF